MYVGYSAIAFLWFSYVVTKVFHVVSVSRSVFVKVAKSHGRHGFSSSTPLASLVCNSEQKKKEEKKKENEAANLGDTIMALRVS